MWTKLFWGWFTEDTIIFQEKAANGQQSGSPASSHAICEHICWEGTHLLASETPSNYKWGKWDSEREELFQSSHRKSYHFHHLSPFWHENIFFSKQLAGNKSSAPHLCWPPFPKKQNSVVCEMHSLFLVPKLFHKGPNLWWHVSRY